MAFFLFFPQTQRPLWYPAYEQKQNKLHLKISQDNNPVGAAIVIDHWWWLVMHESIYQINFL